MIFHTGWLSLIGKESTSVTPPASPGSGVEGAKYLTSARASSPSALTPGRSKSSRSNPRHMLFEVHQILLPMNGTYILENMDTAELAKDKAYEFLFVLGLSRASCGGCAKPMINPVAIR